MANDFLVFGGAAGANVLTQAQYAAMAQRTSGFVAGVAKSQELNKVWRQSSIMAATLAQFIANKSGLNVVDDGTITTLLTSLDAALNAQRVAASGSVKFTTAGVTPWVVPAGVTRVFVKVIGGGGGGGKRQALAALGAGGGAGGGGYAEGWVTVTPGATISITVGAGGAGATVSNTSGANGGTSSFGAFMSATGGGGGGVTSGAGGGVGTGGSRNTSLGPGTSGISFSNSGGTDNGLAGGGGGPGGAQITYSSGSAAANGNNGIGPGGGGGGAVFGGNGGSGADGYVEVEW